MFDALVLQWRVSVDYTEVHTVPHRQSFFRVSIIQDRNKRARERERERESQSWILRRERESQSWILT